MMCRVLITLVGSVLLTLSGTARGDDSQDVLKRLKGEWVVESSTISGKEFPPGKGGRVVFSGDKMTVSPAGVGKSRVDTFKIDVSKTPHEMDYLREKENAGFATPKLIFELDGDTLKICQGRERPKEFTDNKQLLMVLKRKK